jgi:predicted DNA-binding ribbon-helix-helix protein
MTRIRRDQALVEARRAQRAERRAVMANKVQTGVRMEKRLVKVLKALAELREVSLGDLLEELVRSGFRGTPPFAASEVQQIAELSRIYGLDLDERSAVPENPAPEESL